MPHQRLKQPTRKVRDIPNSSKFSDPPLPAAYLKNLHTWSTTATPPPKNAASGTRSSRARATRSSALTATPTTYTPTPIHQQAAAIAMAPQANLVPPNPPRPPLPSTQQALQSTYASRLRTGATLLMQPILASASATTTRAATRRGGVINYADPGSGDDLPDAGALDSDDSDFQASGGTRTSIRQSRTRMATGMTVFNSTTGVHSVPHPTSTSRPEKTELDQSYLGMIPPARFIKAKPVVVVDPKLPEPPYAMASTPHEYPYVIFAFVLLFCGMLTASHNTVLQILWKNKHRNVLLWFLSG